MRIPYVDLAAQHRPLKTELLNALSGVIDGGKFILGEAVGEFERRFAELCGVRHAVAVNSGTDALGLALKALDVGAGDEVITVPNSFVASTSCIIMTGAKAVFVDAQDDFTMDVSKIESAITAKTKAILPVHLTGRPVDMEPLLKLSVKYGIHVIEDCAQSVAARYRGKPVGSFGIVNCFSLHPLKTLNALGDGGIVTTDNKDIYEKVQVHRNLGLKTRDNCIAWCGNSRLDTIQAAFLLVKLDHIEEWTAKRRANAIYYQKHLSKVHQVVCPNDEDHFKAVYHTFVIQAEQRDALKTHLHKCGIGTAIHYPRPIHLQQCAADLGFNKGDFPVTEYQAARILSLPIHQNLQEKDLEYVVEAIIDFYRSKHRRKVVS